MAVTGSQPTHPRGKAVASSHSCWFSSALIPLFLPSFPDSFLTGLSAHNLVFGSTVPKKKGFQGTGEKAGPEIWGWTSKSLRKGARKGFLKSIPSPLPECWTPFLCHYYIPRTSDLFHSSPRFQDFRFRKPFKQKD